MGRGVALQFKNTYPDNFKAYRAACDRGEVQPGLMFVFQSSQLGNPRYIINFPTKRHWRSKSRFADVESGLDALAREIRQRGIKSVAVPPLATGLGGLAWKQVRPAIESSLGDLEGVTVTVFEPGSVAADGRPNRSREAPHLTPARAVLIGLANRYLRGLLDPSITLLEIHKLMYFMEESGEPLDLRFVKEYHGPYSPRIRFLMQELEGHYLLGYRDGGDSPDKAIQIVPGAVEDAEGYLAGTTKTRERFERVADLVSGFESPFGLELLSTVHWIATKADVISDDELARHVYAWGPQKSKFHKEQIRIAIDVLRREGWIDSRYVPGGQLESQKDLSRIGSEDAEQLQLFNC